MIVNPLTVPRAYRHLLDQAERHPRRAVVQAERLVRAADPWAHSVFAWALLCWERFDRADRHFALSAAAFAEHPDRFGALACAYGQLLIAQRRQTRTDLVSALADLSAAYTAADDPLTAALVRLDQARQLNLLGRAQEADRILLQIAPDLAADPPSRARLDRACAVTAYLQGDYPAARRLLAAAETTLRSRRLYLDLARCWVELAAVAVYQEELPESLELHTRAVRWFILADLPLQIAFCLKGAALVATRLGHYDLALAQSLGAASRFRAIGRVRDLAACVLNLGNLYFQTGHWEAALAAYTYAEGRFALGEAVGHQAIARRNQAMVYRVQRQLRLAWQTLRSAERQAVALGMRSEIAEIWALRAAILLDRRRYAAAHQQYLRAAAMFQTLGNLAAAAECLLELGWLYLEGGDSIAAAQAFAQAAPALQHHPHHAWRLRYGQAQIAVGVGDLPGALGHYVAACAGVAALRGRLADETLSSRIYQLADRMHRDALRFAVRQQAWATALVLYEYQCALTIQRRVARQTAWAPPPQLLAAIQRSLLDPQGPPIDGALTTAWAEAAPAQPDLMRFLSAYAPLPPTPLRLEAIRARLGESFGGDWTCLIPMWLDDQLLLITLTAESLHCTSVAVDPLLQFLIDQVCLPSHRNYTFSDVPFAQGLASLPWERLKLLADRLLSVPVRERLTPGHRLLIVPTGPLHHLPWAALRIGDRWLVECAVVQLIPSLSLLPALAGRSAVGAEALLVGCSRFGDRGVALPYVADELGLVRRRWAGPAATHLDAEANMALFVGDQADRRDLALLHIASHAQLVPGAGQEAHLKLWDGDLDLAAVSQLRLVGALVVLSVCEGAAAAVLPGDEVLGLHWAFLSAGAGAVLAGLWPLGDRDLFAVMDALYTQLRPGADPALALAVAQRALLAGAHGPGPASPAVWGGLCVTGGRL